MTNARVAAMAMVSTIKNTAIVLQEQTPLRSASWQIKSWIENNQKCEIQLNVYSSSTSSVEWRLTRAVVRAGHLWFFKKLSL